MEISYYTIDDLRQPPKRLFRKGCTIWHFDTVEAAISHYQALPATGEKSLGITDGFHVLELVKCLPPYPDDVEGETVWASDYRTLTLWRDRPESAQAESACETAFHPRYRVDGAVLVPVSQFKTLSKRLQDKYLWLNVREDEHSAIRWVYAAGKGWVPPSILYRRTEPPRPGPQVPGGRPYGPGGLHSFGCGPLGVYAAAPAHPGAAKTERRCKR